MGKNTYKNIRRRVRGLVALFLFIMCSVMVMNTYKNYQVITNELFKDSESHVHIIAEHASRTFGEVDRILDIVIASTLTSEKLKSLDEKRLYDTFLAAKADIPQIVSIYFVDSGGSLFTSTLKYPIAKLNLSDRDFFRHHRDTPSDVPFISRPYKNRITNKWSFVFSQRVSNADGSFAGVVGVSLEMFYFESLYAEIFDETPRTITLLRDDGYAIVAFPPEEGIFTGPVKTASLDSKLRSSTPSGVFLEKNVDGKGSGRLIAYHRLPANYPLVAQMSLDWDSALSAWKSEALVNSFLLMLFGGLAVVLSRLLVLKLHELEISEDQRSLLSLIVAQSPVSVVITDSHGSITYVNQRFSSVTGYGSEEAIGNKPSILKSGCIPPETFQTMWANLVSGQIWTGELCNKKKDGSLYWEMAYIFPVVDSEGTITHFAAVKEDITERKQATEKLEEALANIKILKDILPICMYCKKIRDDDGYWSQLDSYIRSHTDSEFSHGICPECLEEHYAKDLSDWKAAKKKAGTP